MKASARRAAGTSLTPPPCWGGRERSFSEPTTRIGGAAPTGGPLHEKTRRPVRRGSGDASVLHHPAFDSFAGLANVLGEQRAFLDALEDLLGFLAVSRRGIAHESDRIVDVRGHRLALLRCADQLRPHRLDFLGGGFIVAHHGLGSEHAYARNTVSMLDVVRQWFQKRRGDHPVGQYR